MYDCDVPHEGGGQVPLVENGASARIRALEDALGQPSAAPQKRELSAALEYEAQLLDLLSLRLLRGQSGLAGPVPPAAPAEAASPMSSGANLDAYVRRSRQGNGGGAFVMTYLKGLLHLLFLRVALWGSQ